MRDTLKDLNDDFRINETLAFGDVIVVPGDLVLGDRDSAVQLLAKIEANNPTRSTIHVIWDNAAYHRWGAVKQWIARPECRIHLIKLPAYCPHLNPIERLWAVMHAYVTLHAYITHNRFYPTQKHFAEAIPRFFRETIPKLPRQVRN